MQNAALLAVVVVFVGGAAGISGCEEVDWVNTWQKESRWLPDNRGTCEPGFVAKIEAPPFEYTAHAEEVITKVIIKAGSKVHGRACFPIVTDGTTACYQVSGIGTRAVRVAKLKHDASCKDIGRVEVFTSHRNDGGVAADASRRDAPGELAAPVQVDAGHDTSDGPAMEPDSRESDPLATARLAYAARAAGIDLDGDKVEEWRLEWHADLARPVRESLDRNGDGKPEIRWDRSGPTRRQFLDRDSNGVVEEMREFERDESATYRIRISRDRNGDNAIDYRITIDGIVKTRDVVDVREDDDPDFDGTFRTTNWVANRLQSKSGAPTIACPADVIATVLSQYNFMLTVADEPTCLSGTLRDEFRTFLTTADVSIVCDSTLADYGNADEADVATCGYDTSSPFCNAVVRIGAGGLQGGQGTDLLASTLFHELLHYVNTKGLHKTSSNDPNDPISTCERQCFEGDPQCQSDYVWDPALCECVCPTSRRCGGACCPSTDICITRTCCPSAQACGSSCCAAGDSCVNGSCCPSAQACGSSCCAAGDSCVNGSCCPSAQACGSSCCPSGAVCTSGTCHCAPGLQMCGGSCVDLMTDKGNCGQCGIPCGYRGCSDPGFSITIQECQAGQCATAILPCPNRCVIDAPFCNP